ncbi:17-beta-hydroxysteroid dehydrogenase 14 [Mytilus coruscus]|uniref:17-beta-hydroxysteroid dehydrogenase 14 n=1 Tax=Mytilus coruscus TaxID=42192 RepID=A0A6J8C046_MYTCO|nr:17-beta-hydroxysteroid dehydrogenase 14 [Mytilus coruscus]
MTSLRYKEKVALITGGSRGIGEGCVDVFVENGAKVVFCSNDDTEGQDLERNLNSTGPGKALFIYGDVTQESDIKNIVEKTVEEFGRIDCLINNAGTHPLSHTIDEFSAEDFRKLLDLNLINYFLFSKYSLPYLRKTEGNIINISSLVNQLGQEQAVTYVATKGAITSMTKALAIDEAKYNVRLLGRLGTIEEVGQACLFLASDATFCTGIELNLSAGAELNYGNKMMRKQKTSAN